MKILIKSTTILSMALYGLPPGMAGAQDLPAEVVCVPEDPSTCPEGVVVEEPVIEEVPAEEVPVEEVPVEEPVVEEPAPEEVPVEEPMVEEVAPEEAPVEEPVVEETAPEEAPVEEPVIEEVAPEEAPVEEPMVEETAPEAAPVEEPMGEETAPEEAAAEEAVTGEAAPEEAPVEEPMVEETAPEEAPAEEAVTGEAAPESAPTEEAATEEAAPAEETAAEPLPQVLTEEEIAAQQAQDQEAIAAAQAAEAAAAAEALADPNLVPVEAPVVAEEAAQGLNEVLAATAPPAEASAETTAIEAPLPAAAAAADPTVPPSEQPVPETATVTTETVAATDTRSAAQEFAAAPVAVAPGKKSGLSDLEKAGLVALGALAIGAMLNNSQKQVVSNTGDRVVVRQNDGSYQIFKDDNALLREPGSKVTTQSFQDGSTRTIVTRADGSQISTIRDASGRVLQRVAYDRAGRGTVLIDDLVPETPIRVSELPRPRPSRIDLSAPDAEMRLALAAAEAEEYGQFSLRQIRTIPEVRRLAPTVDLREITFASGSAALGPDQARNLAALGKFVTRMIEANPGEVLLIEGHTDAVGSAASNLTLSDRRAETVAKALTEYYGVPPENMVVQGYGESELLVPTAGDERANRRVALRIITPLLRQ